ncbi:Protein of unknown function [Bacillus cytotoxicus]|nr:Protein of unknown function [Bacillus cytotoxicus]
MDSLQASQLLVFIMIGAVAIVLGCVLWLLSKKLVKWME